MALARDLVGSLLPDGNNKLKLNPIENVSRLLEIDTWLASIGRRLQVRRCACLLM